MSMTYLADVHGNGLTYTSKDRMAEPPENKGSPKEVPGYMGIDVYSQSLVLIKDVCFKRNSREI